MSSNDKAASMSGKTDEELIRITLDGDTRAFDELVRRHSRRLHYTLLQMTGSEADAYDIAQDAFLKAYRSLRDFNGDAAFYTWLYKIATNKARNYLRQRKKGVIIALDDTTNGDPLEKNSELTDGGLISDPVRGAQVKDLKAKLEAALEQLSPNHREVVTLCDIMGQSYPEVAQQLGISEGTLRSRVHYAHKQLQGLLGDVY